jgi:chromosome segregation ATPase
MKLRVAEKEGREQRDLLARLTTQLTEAESWLGEVKEREAQYREAIAQLSLDKGNLSRDIDGLLEEMEKLEAGLNEQRSLKEASELDVQRLKEDLDKLKDRAPRPRQRRKKLENTGKRFKVLYKNLIFTERALEGFLDLTDEFQLKAEEVIHRLNQDESSVPLRRKVFAKGGRTNVLEAEFSYSGRIYFQKESQGKIRVITIGTKNSQDQDLAFIESLR